MEQVNKIKQTENYSLVVEKRGNLRVKLVTHS